MWTSPEVSEETPEVQKLFHKESHAEDILLNGPLDTKHTHEDVINWGKKKQILL